MNRCRLEYVETFDSTAWNCRQLEAGRNVEAFLARCNRFTRSTFKSGLDAQTIGIAPTVEGLLGVLLRSQFNYQSKGRVAHLIPDLRQRIECIVRAGRPLPLYFLYHGGYRASPSPALDALSFHPDATELLTLFQAARLQHDVLQFYAPGVSFHIVINNGVAARTNGISYAATEGYVARLRQMIADLEGDDFVSVLVQSELGLDETLPAKGPEAKLDEAGHRIVERFLGRSCSLEEAEHRSSVYLAEETVWGQCVRQIVDEASGLYMRQIAHPACLSFRPFPGGAIRVQNGTIGFKLREAGRDPVPFLITANIDRRNDMIVVPVRQDLTGLGGSVIEDAA